MAGGIIQAEADGVADFHGGDGKQRFGFVAGFRNNLLNGRNLDYLFAVLPSDWVRLVLYSPGYVDNQGDLVNKQCIIISIYLPRTAGVRVIILVIPLMPAGRITRLP